jgi:hypothetical protein
VVLSLDVCGRAQYDTTPLHEAALSGKPECVRLLLDRGADKDARNHVRAPHASAAAASAARAASLPRAQAFSLSMLRAARRGARGGACGPCFGRSVWGCAAAQPDRVARAASPPRHVPA